MTESAVRSSRRWTPIARATLRLGEPPLQIDVLLQLSGVEYRHVSDRAVGNLTLFAGKLNIGASNNPYHKKRGAYVKSAFKLTQRLPTDYRKFRFKEVEARSRKLAELALQIWPAM